jgi:hypothetical protein
MAEETKIRKDMQGGGRSLKSRYYSGTSFEGRWKIEIPAEIRIENITNTILERYHFSIPLYPYGKFQDSVV